MVARAGRGARRPRVEGTCGREAPAAAAAMSERFSDLRGARVAEAVALALFEGKLYENLEPPRLAPHPVAIFLGQPSRFRLCARMLSAGSVVCDDERATAFPVGTAPLFGHDD